VPPWTLEAGASSEEKWPLQRKITEPRRGSYGFQKLPPLRRSERSNRDVVHHDPASEDLALDVIAKVRGILRDLYEN